MIWGYGYPLFLEPPRSRFFFQAEARQAAKAEAKPSPAKVEEQVDGMGLKGEPVEVGSLSYYLQGVGDISKRWLGSTINSSVFKKWERIGSYLDIWGALKMMDWFLLMSWWRSDLMWHLYVRNFDVEVEFLRYGEGLWRVEVKWFGFVKLSCHWVDVPW